MPPLLYSVIIEYQYKPQRVRNYMQKIGLKQLLAQGLFRIFILPFQAKWMCPAAKNKPCSCIIPRITGICNISFFELVEKQKTISLKTTIGQYFCIIREPRHRRVTANSRCTSTVGKSEFRFPACFLPQLFREWTTVSPDLPVHLCCPCFLRNCRQLQGTHRLLMLLLPIKSLH